MKLRLAKHGEKNKIMSIIDQAKAYLKEQNIDQWQTGYPDLACVKQDIKNQKGYFLVDKNEILGYVCIDFDGEPAYNELNGTWLSDEKYVVAHRVALESSYRQKGLSTQLFQLVEEIAIQNGIKSFRIDTHRDNKIMQHAITKYGFQYCGSTNYANRPRIAYEKLL